MKEIGLRVINTSGERIPMRTASRLQDTNRQPAANLHAISFSSEGNEHERF